ncbi:hypothetical protein TL16_g04712 [Triparma laevis f. inornata]|uniref:Vacuolar protein sorting-associated protein 51 homolog n=1 Tax=Triparma laevis f. inornata TaxID=1714386 RepID=A0A9W7AFU6_9STRA|nr:hypothetical protein TL16_g04712 [Triparma laevis f. inornata]
MSSSDDSSSESESDDEMRRNIMASYYGKGVVAAEPAPTPTHTASSDLGHSLPPSSSPSKTSPSSSDPLSSSTFDPLSFTRTLLLESPCDDLLTKSTTLYTSSQTLDSTMQTLVYENYSKFISATDSIRLIGLSTSTALQSMRVLVGKGEEISVKSKNVEEGLKEGREDVNNLFTLKLQISKLHQIRTLPNLLKELICQQRFAKACRTWLESKDVLIMYGGRFKILENIKKQCESIINSMVSKLKKTLEEGKGGSYRWWFEIGRGVEILGEGGEDFMVKVFNKAESSFNVTHESSCISEKLKSLQIYGKLGCKVFGSVDLDGMYVEILKGWEGEMIERCDGGEGVEVEVEDVRVQVNKFNNQKWTNLITTTTATILRRQTAFSYHTLRLSTIQLLLTWLNSGSMDVIKEIKKGHVDCLKGLKRGNMDEFSFTEVCRTEARRYCIWVAGCFESLAGVGGGRKIVGMEKEEEGYEDDLNSSLVSRHEAAVEEDPFNINLSEVEKKGKEVRGEDCGVCLKIAVLCREAEGVLVESASKSVGRFGGGMEEDVDKDGAVSLRFNMAAGACLREYVGERGMGCGRALGMGVGSKTGRRTWTRGENVVRERFGGVIRAAPAKVVVEGGGFSSATYGGSVGQQRSGGLAMDIEKMFAEKIVIYGNVEFSRESVVSGVFKIALQSLVIGARRAR